MNRSQTQNHSRCLLVMLAAMCIASAGSSVAKTEKAAKSVKKETSKSKPENQKTPKAVDTSDTKAETFVNTPSFDQALMSKMVFELTNVERRKAGLPLLTANPYLLKSATEHSQDMASRVYFAHKSKGIIRRSDPRDRVQSVGYNPSMVAENIAMIPTYSGQRIQSYPGTGRQVVDTNYNTYRQIAETSMREWMNSPGHRKNILSPQLKCLGVGVALGLKNNVPYVYLTQNFGG